jgi:hypothetical protein
MLDLVDKVMKQHIQGMAKIQGKPIRVFTVGTADQDDQPLMQAGLAGEKADRIELPFLSLLRLPNIDITDNNITKRVHNYRAYKLFPGTDKETMLTYYRATLHYVLTLFAENRKVSEDIMTGIYQSLRNNCLVTTTIQLPIKDPNDNTKYIGVQMDSDIVMGQKIEQINPQDLSKSQLYKCRIEFDLQNVNVYSIVEELAAKFNVIITTQRKQDTMGETHYEETQEIQ